eukprot:2464175-Karenia_brevis.AAC.1
MTSPGADRRLPTCNILFKEVRKAPGGAWQLPILNLLLQEIKTVFGGTPRLPKWTLLFKEIKTAPGGARCVAGASCEHIDELSTCPCSAQPRDVRAKGHCTCRFCCSYAACVMLHGSCVSLHGSSNIRLASLAKDASHSRDHPAFAFDFDSMPTRCPGKPSHWDPKPGLRLFTKSVPPANYVPVQLCIFDRSEPGQPGRVR